MVVPGRLGKYLLPKITVSPRLVNGSSGNFSVSIYSVPKARSFLSNNRENVLAFFSNRISLFASDFDLVT